MRTRAIEWRKLVIYSVLCIWAFIVIVPNAYMVLMSFKSLDEITGAGSFSIPKKFHIENYVFPFMKRGFGRYFMNTLFVSSTITVAVVFLCSMAGYSLSKFDYFGKNVIFLFILITMMIPFLAIAIPIFTIARDLHLINNYQGLIIPMIITPFGIFLMRQYMLSIPTEYIEAARVDGYSEFGIYWKIVLPLVKPAIAVLAVLTFLDNYNQFFWPLLIINTDKYVTLPLALAHFQNDYATDYHYLMAMSVLAVVPVLALFSILARHVIKGVTLAGLKG